MNRSDSDSSLSVSQTSEQLRLSLSSKAPPMKPTSLLHGSHSRSEEAAPFHTPNGGNRVTDSAGSPDGGSDSPILMKKIYGFGKSASMSEIHGSMSESSRSLSPNSTEPDTPSPTAIPGMATKSGSRIPQISSKKSPLEEDSCSTGEDTDSTSRKKHTPFKIFKKQKK